jgi:hypothetical protein
MQMRFKVVPGYLCQYNMHTSLYDVEKHIKINKLRNPFLSLVEFGELRLRIGKI